MAIIPTSVSGGGRGMRSVPRANGQVLRATDAVMATTNALNQTAQDATVAIKSVQETDRRHEALNAARQDNDARVRANKLIYGDGETEGLLSRKGHYALNAQKDFDEKFKQIRSDALMGITDIETRDALSRDLEKLYVHSNTVVGRHVANQRTSYSAELLEARVNMAAQEAGYDFESPETLRNSLDLARSSASAAARMKGFAPGDDAYNALLKEQEANVYAAHFKSAFSVDDPARLSQSVAGYEILRSQGKLSPKLVTQLDGVVQKAIPKIRAYKAYTQLKDNAAGGDDVFKSIILAESNGQHTDPKTGKITTSPVGAKGIAQLMEPTAREMAKELGINPDTWMMEEVNAVLGQAYFDKMKAKYNDNTLAVMAYNAGPGAVDDFMNGTNKTGKNKSGLKLGNPLNGDIQMDDFVARFPFMETRNYVNKVMGNLGASDTVDMAEAERAAAGLEPEAGKQLIAMVKEQNARALAAKQEDVGNFFDQAMPYIYGGKMAKMPPDMRDKAERLGYLDDIDSYTSQTKPEVGRYLYSLSPEELKKVDLNSPDMRLGLSQQDYNKWLKRQEGLSSAKNVVTASQRVKMVKDSFARMGLNTGASGKAEEKLAGQERFVRFNELLDVHIDAFAEDNNNRYPTGIELQKIIDKLFIEGEYDIAGIGNAAEFVYDIKASDIPEDDAEKIAQRLAERGKPLTDAALIKGWVDENYATR